MRTTFASVLAEPQFRVLFGCRSLAIAADTLRIVALSMLIFSTTGSPLLAALTFGIGFAPQAVGGLLLGALADRIRPRLLISAGYAAECVSASILAFTEPPVWLMLVIVGLVASMTPVFAGASSRLVAEVLTGERYVLGRSLWTTAASAAQLLGLAMGGAAAAGPGSRRALAISAALHLTACVVTRLRLADMALPATSSTSVLRQTMRVNRALLATTEVRRLMLAHWLPPAFAVGAESLLVVYVEVRGLPPGFGGVLVACLPVGMIIGNLVVGRLLDPSPRHAAPLVVLMGLPFTAFPLDPHPVILAVLVIISGTGVAYMLACKWPSGTRSRNPDVARRSGCCPRDCRPCKASGPPASARSPKPYRPQRQSPHRALPPCSPRCGYGFTSPLSRDLQRLFSQHVRREHVLMFSGVQAAQVQ
jgi:predicted MFS family arabinose efflux permease